MIAVRRHECSATPAPSEYRRRRRQRCGQFAAPSSAWAWLPSNPADRSGAVSRRPQALASHANAWSRLGAACIRSRVVSSIRVRGGVRAGWRARSRRAGSMNDDLRGLPRPSVLERATCLARVNRNVNAPAWRVGKAVKFGCAVMTKRGSRPCAQDSRPQQCDPGWSAGEGGVDTAVQRLPAADMQLRVSDPTTVSRLGDLPAGDDAVLEFEQFLACVGEVDRHNPNCCTGPPGTEGCQIRLWTRVRGMTACGFPRRTV